MANDFDLLNALRNAGNARDGCAPAWLADEAADEIERLRAELEKETADVCRHCGINKVRAQQATDF